MYKKSMYIVMVMMIVVIAGIAGGCKTKEEKQLKQSELENNREYINMATGLEDTDYNIVAVPINSFKDKDTMDEYDWCELKAQISFTKDELEGFLVEIKKNNYISWSENVPSISHGKEEYYIEISEKSVCEYDNIYCYYEESIEDNSALKVDKEPLHKGEIYYWEYDEGQYKVEIYYYEVTEYVQPIDFQGYENTLTLNSDEQINAINTILGENNIEYIVDSFEALEKKSSVYGAQRLYNVKINNPYAYEIMHVTDAKLILNQENFNVFIDAIEGKYNNFLTIYDAMEVWEQFCTRYGRENWNIEDFSEEDFKGVYSLEKDATDDITNRLMDKCNAIDSKLCYWQDNDGNYVVTLSDKEYYICSD